MEQMSLDDRHADDIMSNNMDDPRYEMCKTCKFRDVYGYAKVNCEKYPLMYEDEKPEEVAYNEDDCIFYEEGESNGWDFRKEKANLKYIG